MKGKIKKIFFGVIIVFVVVGIIGAINGKNKSTTEVATDNSQQKQPKYTVSDVQVESNSFSQYVTGVLKNNTDSEKKYLQITFEVYDKDGNKVGTAFDNINDLSANGTWKFKAIYLGSEKDVTFKIDSPKVDGF